MGFSHLTEQGDAVMVDVTDKGETRRRAVAVGRISMSEECFRAIRDQSVAKGDVLAVARVAGIMAAKRTPEWIPLCHVLCLTKCAVEFSLAEDTHEIEARCTVCCTGKTGVEMEALTGASAALLTIYDMAKAMDKRMVITGVHLLEKQGGKSGDFVFGPNAGAQDAPTDHESGRTAHD